MATVITPRTRALQIRQEGERVLVVESGRTLVDLPWDAALELARAVQAQAKRAEELAKREQIVMDQAILTRLGARFGLTSHPALLKMAANEAAWNSALRRYIRPARARGIESQAAVGEPAVIRHPPDENPKSQIPKGGKDESG